MRMHFKNLPGDVVTLKFHHTIFREEELHIGKNRRMKVRPSVKKNMQ